MSVQKHVLIVEDDATQARTYIEALEAAGWSVAWAQDIASASVHAADADVVLADRGLPDGDGISLLKAFAMLDVQVPVILLTSLNTIEERVRGLDEGASDYVGKGVDVREIVMRCEAQWRNATRDRGLADDKIIVGPAGGPDDEVVVIAVGERLVARQSVFSTLASKQLRQKYTLEPTAFAILLHLVRNAGKTVRVTEIEQLFFHRTEFTRQGVRNAISKIRRCVDAGEAKTFLHTYLAQQIGDEPGYIFRKSPTVSSAKAPPPPRAAEAGQASMCNE